MGNIKINDFSEKVLSKEKLLKMFPIKSGEVVNYVSLSKFGQEVKRYLLQQRFFII